MNASSRLETMRSFTGDGGRPSEVGLQGQASNRHKLRGLRAFVVSVAGKGGSYSVRWVLRRRTRVNR